MFEIVKKYPKIYSNCLQNMHENYIICWKINLVQFLTRYKILRKGEKDVY